MQSFNLSYIGAIPNVALKMKNSINDTIKDIKKNMVRLRKVPEYVVKLQRVAQTTVFIFPLACR